MLLDDAMPRMLEKLVGPAAFIDAFEIVSFAVEEAARSLVEALKNKTGEVDEREALRIVSAKVAEFIHDVEGVEAEVEVSDGEITVRFRGLDVSNAREASLRAAILMGIVGGVLKALGYCVKPAKDRRHAEIAKRHSERGTWVVWLETEGGEPVVKALCIR